MKKASIPHGENHRFLSFSGIDAKSLYFATASKRFIAARKRSVSRMKS